MKEKLVLNEVNVPILEAWEVLWGGVKGEGASKTQAGLFALFVTAQGCHSDNHGLWELLILHICDIL